MREDLPSAVKTFTYAYDDAGNITEKKEYSYTTGSLANKTPLDIVSYTYGDSTWGDLLTSYDGQTITYDNIGNPLSYRGKTLTWNGRQLKSVGNTVYTYDVNGLRTSKTVGNTTTYYTWEDGNLIHQTDGTTSLHFWYGENGAEAFTYITGNTSETYYYVKDALGNVIGIYDDTGDMLVRYDFDAWGRLRTTWYKNDDYAAYSYIGNINPIRYKGYFYDRDTGFYYLQSRYYDPITGRFLNVDDVRILNDTYHLLGNNMFSYCANNPVMFSDSTGFFAIAISVSSWVIYLIITIILGAALVIITSDPKFQRALSELVNAIGDWIKYAAKSIVRCVKEALSKANQRARTDKWENHHIVARTSSNQNAVHSRYLLCCAGVGINSSYNLVRIRYNLHKHLHTAAYYAAVDTLVSAANGYYYKTIRVLKFIKTVLNIASAKSK